MRDRQFVAEHRGGLLTKENHQKLIRWARMCSEHVIQLLDKNIDERLFHALDIAKEWENGKVKVGVAMKASAAAHAVARETSDPVLKAIARSIGHTVATAHMADHSVGGALYALKALKFAGKSIKDEWYWQINQMELLLPEMAELIQATLINRSGASLRDQIIQR